MKKTQKIIAASNCCYICNYCISFEYFFILMGQKAVSTKSKEVVVEISGSASYVS